MKKFQNHSKKSKLVNVIVFMFVFAFLGISAMGATFTTPATATVVRRGDTGEAVKVIQQRLKNWDYYKYSVDGIFGLFTQQAVISFQKKNSLVTDGIVGPKTAAAMGINLSKLSVTQANPVATATPKATTTTKTTTSSNTTVNGDVQLLAKLVYAEAKGEIYRGKVAVAAVVLNRVDDSRFPNSISGVIYQPKQFTCVANGAINNTPDAESLKAARDALNGVDPSGGAVFFYNAKTTTSSWNSTRKVITVIGNHTFTE